MSISKGTTPLLRMCGGGHFGEKDLPCKSAKFYNEVVSNKKRGKPKWHNVKSLLWWWSLGKRFLLKHVFLQELVLSGRPNPHHWFKIIWNILWKHDTAISIFVNTTNLLRRQWCLENIAKDTTDPTVACIYQNKFQSYHKSIGKSWS